MYYMGASDTAKEGEWRWLSDNQIANISSCIAGEPNNAGGIENCLTVVKWPSGFNDAICTGHPFICERFQYS